MRSHAEGLRELAVEPADRSDEQRRVADQRLPPRNPEVVRWSPGATSSKGIGNTTLVRAQQIHAEITVLEDRRGDDAARLDADEQRRRISRDRSHRADGLTIESGWPVGRDDGYPGHGAAHRLDVFASEVAHITSSRTSSRRSRVRLATGPAFGN